MKYKHTNVNSPTSGLGEVLASSDMRAYMGKKAREGAALFTAMAPRGSQKRPHVPLAATAEASTEWAGDRWVGVVTAGASYAIASEVGNRRRPRGAHTLRQVATIMGKTGRSR